MEFLTSDAVNKGLLSFAPSRDSDKAQWTFTVLAESAEQAESRAAAILVLLDQGVSRPIQLAAFKRREGQCDEVRKLRAPVEAARQMEAAIAQQMKPFEEYTADMLSGLRVQQLQLEIDLTGVKARIAACDKLMSQPNLKAERREQIENAKITAEIELSGFEARRAKSEEFIGKVKSKIAYAEHLVVAQGKVASAKNALAIAESRLRTTDNIIRAFAPLSLVDDKVIVQPVEWTP